MMCYISLMSNSTQTRDRYVGTLVDWNKSGYIDIYYPDPSRDTNCSANKSSTKNPSYASKLLSIVCKSNLTMDLSEILHLVA
jgi:hypothetical protein